MATPVQALFVVTDINVFTGEIDHIIRMWQLDENCQKEVASLLNTYGVPSVPHNVATDQFAAYLKEYTVNFTNEESYSFAESYVRDLKSSGLMVSEIPVDGFVAMNTDDDVSNKQSILAAQAAAVQAVEDAKASSIAVQAAYAAQLERDMVADRKKDQESACARIAKVSATKAKTTKITETIVKIEAAIVEDLAVIAEDELRTKTATFKQTRLKVKAIQEKNLNEPIPEDDDFDPVAELLAMGFF
jgi:hypothetical protein